MLVPIAAETEKLNVEWPGWPLSGNVYGDEFDEAARIRMILGSRKLIPYMLKYKSAFQRAILEIGPFFNPLLKQEALLSHIATSHTTTFIENDPHAVKWLRANYDSKVIDIDLNHISGDSALLGDVALFDVIVISQVMNYVDHRLLLACIYPVLSRGGLIFINNVINYGIPVLFSDKRPVSDHDIVAAAAQQGFAVLESQLLPRQFEQEPADRLVLVLSKE